MTQKTASHQTWDDLPLQELKGSIKRRFICGEDLMLAQVFFAKGDVVPLHSHPNEQITYVISGALKFWFGGDDGQAVTVAAGETVTIPGGLPHRALAIEDTFELDIFNPPRQDWISGSDDYLKT